MYHRILVPLDGSELAEQILPHVIELAKGTGAEIVLLRVPDVPVSEYTMPGAESGIALYDQARREAENYLEHISCALRLKGLRVQTLVGADESVYATILNQAQALQADLIAMSTHGRSGLARLVMGSVADDIVRHAGIPVLLTRPQPVPGTLPLHVHHPQTLFTLV
jgi:nucleotide-binding universal stress UspA family protein